MNPLLIPDLSHYEPGADFHTMKAGGIPAVISKVSQGTTGVDPLWADYRDRARSVGLIAGGYHYLLPGNVTAQMEHFLGAADFKPGDLRPIIDAEAPGLGKADTVQALEYLGANGLRPILYASLSFWEDVLGKVNNHALWLAAYRDTKPALPQGVVLFAWQHTDHGACPGVPQLCDMSYFYGDLAALKSYCL